MTPEERRRRLEAIRNALPAPAEIEEAERRRTRELLRQRVHDGTATPADFATLHRWGVGDMREFLQHAGQTRYRFTRGLPLDPGLLTTAELIVTAPHGESVADLLQELTDAARSPGATSASHQAWAHARELLVHLGSQGSQHLRQEYQSNLGSYDPQWRALRREGAAPYEMVQRVEAGTADGRDFFHVHMPHIKLFQAELLVCAVGRRRARQQGDAIPVTDPASVSAELLSYPPEDTPPARLWSTIRSGANRTPTPESIDSWREYNRCRVVVGRWDQGRRLRGILQQHWDVFEAEHQYLSQSNENAL